MRLIDADALENSLGVEDEDFYAKIVISEAPEVDAVEVVRCKNCKHWWKKNEVCTHPRCCDSFLAVVEAPPEHFCGYGERKAK